MSCRRSISAAVLVAAAGFTACEQPPAATREAPGTTASARETTASGREATTSAPATCGDLSTRAVAEHLIKTTPFSGPDALADALVQAERVLADPGTNDELRDSCAWTQQQAYRDLAANPAWRDEVRAHLPQELQKAFDRNVRAASNLRRLHSPAAKLPAGWDIVPPSPVDELRGYYENAEARFGVPWYVLAAIHFVETRFGRVAGDSSTGAQGPMQFMPRTWQAYGEGDVHNTRDAIMAAGRYLAASGAPDHLRRALFAYNRSDHYVEAVLAYAENIQHYEHYLDTYHRWRVYYRTVDGDIVLERGYGS